MNPRDKLKNLEKSLEEGVVEKAEYDKTKKELEDEIVKFDKAVEKVNKNRDTETADTQGKISEKVLLLTILVIAAIIAALFFGFRYYQAQQPVTLEEFHVANLKGKLKSDQGYVHNEIYSFVKFEDLWHTDLTSPGGTKIFSMAFRYSPRDVEDISIEGTLNTEFFNNQNEYYVTFNPKGEDFSQVALAVADFNTHMANVFLKKPIAACDRNETRDCEERPIVTCEDKDKLVFYIKEAEEFRAYYDDNCLVVEGNGFNLVRGADRILFNLYGLMGQ